MLGGGGHVGLTAPVQRAGNSYRQEGCRISTSSVPLVPLIGPGGPSNSHSHLRKLINGFLSLHEATLDGHLEVIAGQNATAWAVVGILSYAHVTKCTGYQLAFRCWLSLQSSLCYGLDYLRNY